MTNTRVFLASCKEMLAYLNISLLLIALIPATTAFRHELNSGDDRAGRPKRNTGTESPISASEETRKNEKSVIDTILRVVDHKFDTLSSRLSALERAVNGLQYYSVRQFRLLYTNSKSINSQVQDISTRVSGLEIEISRGDLTGIRDNVASMQHDIKVLLRQNKDMFESVEETISVVDRNVNKGVLEVKDALNRKIPGTLALLRKSGVRSGIVDANGTYVTNDEVDSENLQGDQAKTENENTNAPPKVIDTSPERSEIDKFFIGKYFQQLEDKMEGYFNATFMRVETKDATTTPVPSESPVTPPPCVSMEMAMDMARKSTSNVTTVLSHLQGKMAESVKFQRDVEHMLETLITNSDSLGQETSQLTDTVNSLSEKLTKLEKSTSESDRRAELESHSLLEAKRLAEKHAKSGQLLEDCRIPKTFEKRLGEILARNASHVFDLLRELGQISTVSLSSTVLDLHEDIIKLEKLSAEHYSQIATEKRDRLQLKERDDNVTKRDIEETLNLTRASFNIIEAVSSNTGWLPLLLDTIDLIGITANETLITSQRIYEELKERAKTFVQSISHKTPNDDDRLATRNSGTLLSSARATSTKYSTVESIERFLPSIVNLLSKSAPIITLVNGTRDTEGRVEIHHCGIWGTVCSHSWVDNDAAAVCRSIGFPGGYLSRKGQFGEGTGPVWFIRADCLRRKLRLKSDANCAYNAMQAGTCSHKDDLGVVCDRMPRIRSLDGVTYQWKGAVEVFNEATWGGICLDGWNQGATDVVCKQLGYAYGRLIAGERYDSRKPVWLSNVSCVGTETTIDECAHAGWKWHHCPSETLVAVICVHK